MFDLLGFGLSLGFGLCSDAHKRNRIFYHTDLMCVLCFVFRFLHLFDFSTFFTTLSFCK